MAAIAANQRAALAEEPGCLAFVVGRDVDHSDEFHVYELYRDHKALEEHRESAHFLEWRRVASEVLESDGIESRLSHVVMELQSADCSREDQ